MCGNRPNTNKYALKRPKMTLKRPSIQKSLSTSADSPPLIHKMWIKKTGFFLTLPWLKFFVHALQFYSDKSGLKMQDLHKWLASSCLVTVTWCLVPVSHCFSSVWWLYYSLYFVFWKHNGHFMQTGQYVWWHWVISCESALYCSAVHCTALLSTIQ